LGVSLCSDHDRNGNARSKSVKGTMERWWMEFSKRGVKSKGPVIEGPKECNPLTKSVEFEDSVELHAWQSVFQSENRGGKGVEDMGELRSL
jgi:hypothetical protein